MSHINTPFSFHCMICYEEFHPEGRYPVVLPCGHTYVCHLCAERIQVCMECREPLYTMVPKQNVPAVVPGQVGGHSPGGTRTTGIRHMGRQTASAAVVGRHGRATTPENLPSANMTKKRLPLPKNVVLLSLMEATELASEDVRKKFSSSPRSSVDSEDGDFHLRSMNSMLDAEDKEEEKIKIGTSLAVGVSGTYAVAEREGLEILPSRPTKLAPHDAIAATDEDVDTLVRFFHLDQQQANMDAESPRKIGVASASGEDVGANTPARLSYGDRVQIVALEGGWAKLARGYGFVRADKKQLVKVGGPVDRACKLEAMLRSLSNRRKELRDEQNKIDNQFIGLMNDLQMSLQTDEDLTVILGDTFSPPPSPKSCKSDDEEKKHDISEDRVEVQHRDQRSQVAMSIPQHTPQTPVKRQTVVAENPQLSFGCFAGDVFTRDDGAHRGPPILDLPFRLSVDSDVVRQRNCTTPNPPSMQTSLFRAASHPSPNAMRAGAEAWRERNRHQQSPQGIDFRTGMSGHMALLSTSAHPHEYLEQPAPGPVPTVRVTNSTNLRMSSHTGLTMFKPSRIVRSIRNMLDVNAESTQESQREDQTIQQAGSM